jgi:hypothetical protein
MYAARSQEPDTLQTQKSVSETDAREDVDQTISSMTASRTIWTVVDRGFVCSVVSLLAAGVSDG